MSKDETATAPAAVPEQIEQTAPATEPARTKPKARCRSKKPKATKIHLAIADAQEDQAEAERIRGFAKQFAAAQEQTAGFAAKTVAGFVQMGEILLAARRVIPIGTWTRAFQDSKDPLPGGFPISLDRAEMLIRIAERKALSDSEMFRSLPPHMVTLSKMAPGELWREIRLGKLSQDTTLAEARALVSERYPRKAKRALGPRDEPPVVPGYIPSPAAPPAPKPGEPDWRKYLDVGTVDMDSSEQVALLVIQAGGLRPSRDLRRLDIPLVFRRRDGTPWDLLVRDIAEAQHRDEREVLGKLLKALDHRHAIWQVERELGAAEPDDETPVAALPAHEKPEPVGRERAEIELAVGAIRRGREQVAQAIGLAVAPAGFVEKHPDLFAKFTAAVELRGRGLLAAYDELADSLELVAQEPEPKPAP